MLALVESTAASTTPAAAIISAAIVSTATTVRSSTATAASPLLFHVFHLNARRIDLNINPSGASTPVFKERT